MFDGSGSNVELWRTLTVMAALPLFVYISDVTPSALVIGYTALLPSRDTLPVKNKRTRESESSKLLLDFAPFVTVMAMISFPLMIN